MEIDYLVEIIKPLVSHPDKVKVNKSTDEMGVLLTVEADPKDYGRIIGKQGETAKALRTILNCYGMVNGLKISVKVAAPYKPKE